MGMHSGNICVHAHVCANRVTKENQNKHRHTYKTISRNLCEMLFAEGRIFALQNVAERQLKNSIFHMFDPIV